MSETTRGSAPPNIGETTLRIVLDHLPAAREVDENGAPVFSRDALHLMRMVKGLRNHNAGQETIRRVIRSYVPAPTDPAAGSSPPIPIRRAPGVVAQDARAKAAAVSSSAGEVAGILDALTEAIGALSDSLTAFASAAEAMAPRPQRYDAFLGSLERLAELSRLRHRPDAG